MIGVPARTVNRSGVRYQAWRDRAACKGADLSLFFPSEEGGTAQAAKARAICASCPVMAECRQYALGSPERWGIWAGMTERDRRRPRSPGASPFPGVTWNKGAGKWQARAVRDGRRVYLGVFGDEEDAARAVLEAGGAAAPSAPQSRRAA